MKKFVIGTVVLAGAAVASLPYINGMIMEKAFYKCVEEANGIYSDTDMGMSIEVVSYKRGFRSSEIEWKINLGQLKSTVPVDTVIIVDRAAHGLSSVTSHSSLEKNDWYTEAIANYTQGADPLELKTEYKLLGDIISTMAIDDFKVTVDGREAEIRPGAITVKTDREFKKFISEGSWAGFHVDRIFSLSSISLDSELELISTFIWNGKSTFSINNLTAEEEGQRVAINGIKGGYSMNYDRVADRLKSDVSYAIDSIEVPGSTMDNLALEIGVAGLDGTAYEEAMAIYMDLVGALLESIAAAGDDQEAIEEAVQAQVMGLGLQMMAVYEKLLKQGLEFSIQKLDATLPEGRIHGSLSLKLLKDITMAQMLPMAAQPDLLFEYVDIQSALTLPQSMAANAPMLVVPLYPGMQTGFFIEEGAQLKHTGETRDGALYINGLEVEFP